MSRTNFITPAQKADFARALEGLKEIDEILKKAQAGQTSKLKEAGVEDRVVWPILRSIGLNRCTRIKIQDSNSLKTPDYTVYCDDTFEREHLRVEAKNYYKQHPVEQLYRFHKLQDWLTRSSDNDECGLAQVIGSITDPGPEHRHRIVLVTNGRFWVGLVVPSRWPLSTQAPSQIKKRVFLRVDIKQPDSHQILYALNPARLDLLNTLLEVAYWDEEKGQSPKRENRKYLANLGNRYSKMDWRETCRRFDGTKQPQTRKIQKTGRDLLDELKKELPGSCASKSIRNWPGKRCIYLKTDAHHTNERFVPVAAIWENNNSLSFSLYSRIIVGDDPKQEDILTNRGRYTRKVPIKNQDDMRRFWIRLLKEWPEGDSAGGRNSPIKRLPWDEVKKSVGRARERQEANAKGHRQPTMGCNRNTLS